MESNKSIFYLICVALLGGVFVVGYLFLSGDPAPSSGTDQSTAKSSGTDQAERKRERDSKDDETSGFWPFGQDDNESETDRKKAKSSAWGRFGGESVDNKDLGKALQESAEIENNIQKLQQLFMSGQDKNFEALVEELIAKNPEKPEYVAIQGDFYFNMGRYGKAEESIRALLDLQPDNLIARISLGEVLLKQRKIDEAYIQLDRAATENPENIDALYGLMNAYDKKGNFNDGMNRIAELFDKDQGNAAAAWVYANALGKTGKQKMRRRVLESGLKQSPNDPMLLNSVSEIAQREGDHSRAIDLADRAYAQGKTLKIQRDALRTMFKSAIASQDFASAEEVIRRQREIGFDVDTINIHKDIVAQAKAQKR